MSEQLQSIETAQAAFYSAVEAINQLDVDSSMEELMSRSAEPKPAGTSDQGYRFD